MGIPFTSPNRVKGGAANVAHVYANIARSVEAVEGQLMPRHHKGKAKTGNGNANAATGNAATGNTAATNGTTAATTTTTTTTNANCKRHHKVRTLTPRHRCSS